MKLSFGITSHNEGNYLNSLLTSLELFIDEQQKVSSVDYEIVVIDDFSTDESTLATLSLSNAIGTRVIEHSLNDDFATHKNFLNEQCSGDWILQLDADESISAGLLAYLPAIVQDNPIVDAYWFPRINTVSGLTLQHVQKWGWVLTTLEEFKTVQLLDPTSEEYQLLQAYNFIIEEDGGFVTYYEPIVMFPDPQMRLYRKNATIRWEGKVHERIVGYENFSRFPDDVFYAIRHHKEIKRQEQQNSYYKTITR
jgi:glycosyltransferase involved in cell wall biosynthesis